jgi:hypothetical protein
MSDNLQTTPAAIGTPLTPSETKVTEPKQNESVSLLNEDPPKETTETKPKTEGDPPKEGEKKPDAVGAPEKYEPFKLPEGVELSEEVSAEAGALFKDLGLTQIQAQQLVDFHAKTLAAATESVSKVSMDSWMAQKTAWKTEIKADPEIGGKLGEVKARIGKMYDTLGDAKLVKDFKSAMDLTGAGDNPAFIKLFNKLAERLGEGTHVGEGKPPGGSKPSAAQSMYPNLPSQG